MDVDNCWHMSIDRFWILIARKLSGESSTEEVRELEELLRLHPELHFSVEIITNLWNQKAKKNEKQLEDLYASHVERMQNIGIPLQHEENKDEAELPYLLHGSRKNLHVLKLAIAASIIIILTAGTFIFFKTRRSSLPSDNDAVLAVSTKYGSRTNIQLPDGSKVWLNSGSKITYDKQFGKEIREVVLSGEAFFDVVKDPAKPFIIHTASMDIKVLGTQFNVKSYANDKQAEASLIHGSIEVMLKKRGFQKIVLKPNEKIVVMNERLMKDTSSIIRGNNLAEPIIAVQKLNYQTADSSVIETSWLNNQLIFRDESFEEIAVSMERWYGISIRFQDTSYRSMRFTGIITSETIEQALEALQITTSFHFTIRNNTIIITK